MLLAAVAVGAGLSLAGAVMQCILKNPLASPYTLGLSNAAAFGAAFSVIFLQSGAVLSGVLSDVAVPMSAFAFSMVATGIIILLTRVTRVSSETMVLAGIAVSAIFSAGLTLMQYLADPVQLSTIVSWTFGSVSYATIGWDAAIIIVLVASFAYFYMRRWDMNAMNAGDEVAQGLGVTVSTAVVLDDITLDAAALHRHGKRLYVIGDVTVPENASALDELEYLNIRGDARVPEQHREKLLDKLADISGEVKLARPKEVSIVDKPIVKVTKWMLEQQPAGIEVIDCAVVKIADDIPKELLAERLRIEDCGVVKCGEELEDTIAMVCENVGRIGGESDSVMAGLKDMMETKFINAAEYIL